MIDGGRLQRIWMTLRTPTVLYLACLLLAVATGATVLTESDAPTPTVAQQRLDSARSSAWWHRPKIAQSLALQASQVEALDAALKTFLADIGQREMELARLRPTDQGAEQARLWWLEQYRTEVENVQSELAMVKAISTILSDRQIAWLATNKPALLRPRAIPRR